MYARKITVDKNKYWAKIVEVTWKSCSKDVEKM